MWQYGKSTGLRCTRPASVSAAELHVPEPTHSGPQFPPLYIGVASKGLSGYASLSQRLCVLGSAGLPCALSPPGPRLDSSRGISGGRGGSQLSASGQHLGRGRWKIPLTSGLASRWSAEEWGALFWRRVGTSSGKELQGLRGKAGGV